MNIDLQTAAKEFVRLETLYPKFYWDWPNLCAQTSYNRGDKTSYYFFMCEGPSGHYLKMGSVDFSVDLRPDGWWIVGVWEKAERVGAEHDRGPYDTFETAYATLKLLAT